MQFSISNVLAIALSLTLAQAAPAAVPAPSSADNGGLSMRTALANKCAELGLPTNCVTFCGADTDSCFAALFNDGISTQIRTSSSSINPPKEALP